MRYISFTLYTWECRGLGKLSNLPSHMARLFESKVCTHNYYVEYKSTKPFSCLCDGYTGWLWANLSTLSCNTGVFYTWCSQTVFMGAIEFHGEATRGCHWQGHESKAGQAGFHISENTAAQLCIFKKKKLVWYDIEKRFQDRDYWDKMISTDLCSFQVFDSNLK